MRAEEFINYFRHGHPAPASRDVPFRATVEIAPAPWNPRRHLMMVGLKGYDVPKAELPPANLVFLVDTSGSMHSEDKLPLLKQALSALAAQLRAQDRVSIVAYAGSAGLVLPPTPGNRQGEIIAALERLQAGGSTNGGEGITLAYAMARQGFVAGGANRVILATDGDFNVGTSTARRSRPWSATSASRHRADTLGFGQGNYNDAMAERLADVGDGNHAYIDTVLEARKVLVEEMSATLLTIARDVKVRWSSTRRWCRSTAGRLRKPRLQREDFANDRVDAVTSARATRSPRCTMVALVGSGAERLPALRYGATQAQPAGGAELAHLRLRYKRPERTPAG